MPDTEIVRERIQFANAEGERLAALLERPPAEPRAYALFAHCFTCSKDLKSAEVEPEHIAVAILSIKSGSCYETLKEFSIEPSYVTMLIMESMGFEETEVPEKWADYVEINAKLAGMWPSITEKKDALPEADEFKDIEEKRELLSEEAFAE